MRYKYVLLIFFLVILRVRLTAAEEPMRVVSLAPSNTAQAADLGLGSRLVGITKFCTRPGDATDAIVIGTLSHPNLELIATLNPTLVLGDVESNRSETLDRLEVMGFNVLRLGPSQNLENIKRDFLTIAAVVNRVDFAEQYVARVEQRLQQIRNAVRNEPPKRIFVEIWPKPLMTVSRKGFIHHVVEAAGGVNIFADAPVAYPQISIESVLAQKPEIVLILTHSLIDDSRIKRYREFSDFDGALIQQSDASELSQPSLSTFLKAAEYFLKIIHPKIELDCNSDIEDFGEEPSAK